ncbi:hypothetical protein [Thalassotalea piscium]|uniref:Transposase n=1 Tax=Thalassotalea piscium TaxID=1230533 RepID=A0A7X0TU86_9GAMM|nr:hypothetical protein [Thalassotalea piscium]MBB6544066.1 hypothetical protein [Thalassotalea piscium]
MKRKLIRLRKKHLTAFFKNQQNITRANSKTVTLESIAKVKIIGQQYYHHRVSQLQKLNTRQLKKYRKRQMNSGLTGSKYGAICKIQLKPASAVFKKR